MTTEAAYLQLLALCRDPSNSPQLRAAAMRIEDARAAAIFDGVHRIYVMNLEAGTGPSGYGEGRTREAAIESALALAGRHDPNAYFDSRCRCVLYRADPDGF